MVMASDGDNSVDMDNMDMDTDEGTPSSSSISRNKNRSYPKAGPIVCVVSGLFDGAAGALLGSVFGLGQGLWKRQGFKVALRDAGSSAKMFALLSGVHTLVSCFLKNARGKQDALNAGIAGCATGLALSMPGTPDSLLRSCVTFGAFSYIIERFNKPQPALAAGFNSSLVGAYNQNPLHSSFSVLPPFLLPPVYPGSLNMPFNLNNFLRHPYTSL